jgi:hypothetical protein
MNLGHHVSNFISRADLFQAKRPGPTHANSVDN